MATIDNIVSDLKDAINSVGVKKTSAYDTQAVVKRIEGETAWVHIPGGVDETPVKLTIAAHEGDNVQVRVSGGRAFLVGNGSAPPTDDARANQAYTVATVAEGAAENALANAARAAEAADSAQASATRAESAANDAVIAAGDAQTAAASAQTAADTALVSLSTVEDVVGVLNWITEHGTMTLTSDVTVNPAHVYFIVDPAGDYVVGGTHYSVVAEPKDAELSTYYELTVDESVENYVATHVAVDSEGLWLIPEDNATPASSGKKILIATGAGSTYTTAGTYIIEKVNGTDQIVAMFTAAGVSYGDSTTASGNNSFALGQHTTAGGQSSQAAGYYSTATATLSHAEGYATHATSEGATAIGKETTASGDYSFSEGHSTTASGACSHAQGTGTTADQANQVAIGKYNTTNNTNNLFVIGNGSKDGGGIIRKDAFQVDMYGNVNIASGAKYKINGTALAAADVGALADTATAADVNALPISGGTMTSYGQIINGHITNSASRETTPDLTITGKRGVTALLATGSMATNSPGRGTILHCEWDDTSGLNSQLFISNNSSTNGTTPCLKIRGQNSGTWTAWDTVHTDKNAVYGELYGMSSNLTLSTSAKKVALTTFSGSGCQLSSNGIKVANAGTYMINGSAYCTTGYTANDIIHIQLYKGSTSLCDSTKRVSNASPYEIMPVGPIIVTLAANDVIYLYAHNQGGARGTVATNTLTHITLHRIA